MEVLPQRGASFIASGFRCTVYSNSIPAVLTTVKLHICRAMLFSIVESAEVRGAIFLVVASAPRFAVQYILSAMEFARRPWVAEPLDDEANGSCAPVDPERSAGPHWTPGIAVPSRIYSAPP